MCESFSIVLLKDNLNPESGISPEIVEEIIEVKDKTAKKIQSELEKKWKMINVIT